MMNTPKPEITERTKGWRVVRFIIFVMVLAAIEILLTQIPQLAELEKAAKQNDMIALAIAMAMTFVLMLSILVGGMKFTDMTAGWKEQLLGIFNFLWSIGTARVIAYVLARYFSPYSENEGILFLYFFIALLVLMPFQFIAFRAYAKRKGIPMWPNLPRG